MRGFSVLALALAVTVAAAPLGAQATRAVDGRVIRPGGDSTVGVGGAWVVLHRVGKDSAGALDSTRTRPDGRYLFRYRPSGDTAAVYFVSTSRGGVAYFTPPLRAEVVRGSQADMLVYDTTSAPVRISVMGRHVIVTAPDTAKANVRTVVEVYEISNDSSVTRVSRDGGATFEVPLPTGVERITAGDGDISGDAVALEGGRVRVTAPLAPGLRQFSFFYDLPASRDVIDFVAGAAVPVLEVLIEDPRGNATGAGLTAVTPVLVEERPFRRFLAQEVADTATFRIIAPGPAVTGLRMMLVVTAVGAALLLGLGMAFMRKGPAAFARRRDVDPESLALAIAALDAKYERIAHPTEAQKAEHHLARARLKGRLSEALARRDGLR